MAGQAMARVESQMNTLKDWATSSLAAAKDALGALGNIELPTTYPTIYGAWNLPQIAPVSVSPPDDLITSNEDMPTITPIIVPPPPDPPDIDPVILGDLIDITLPELPTIVFPSIDINPPVYSISPPKEWDFVIGDILFSDDPFVQAVINRLTSNINNGGTGLSAEVEAAIWARDLERNEQQLADTTDKTTAMWAKKGFSLPDGMLAHSLSENQKEYMNKMLDRSREISIKQAELEQTNLFKSMELAVSLFDKLKDLMIRYETLSFQAQEATAKYANEYIDLQIKTYMSLVDAYKATAQTYEMIIRAELSKIEIYKAQIEGQKLIGDINSQTVLIYTEQIKAGQAIIERYKTEVEAMVSILEGEKAKVEVNKAQFDAWAKKQDVLIARYNGQVMMYKSESDANVSSAQVQVAYAEATVRATIASMEASQRSFEIAERSMTSKAQIEMEAARGVAQAAAGLAAGAMSAMSAHAQMSYSETQPFKEIGG